MAIRGNLADERHKILLEKVRIESEIDELFTTSKYLAEQHTVIEEARVKYMAINEQSPIHKYPTLSRLAEEETEEVLTLMARQRDMIEEKIVHNRNAIATVQHRLDDIEHRLHSFYLP